MPSRPRLAQISDTPLGAIVPADLTSAVCKKKPPVSAVRAKDLAGWGISFGNYETLQKADMALRGRLISPVGMDAPGKAGVVRMPNKQGFAAMLWNIDQATSQALCTRLSLAERAVRCDDARGLCPDRGRFERSWSPSPRRRLRWLQGSDGQKPGKKKKTIKKTAN